MKSAKRAVATLALMVAAAGCANAGPAQQPRQIILDPSWAEANSTVAGMSKNAGAIARITIEGIVGTEGADGAVYTNFVAHVDSWISTSSGTPDKITIRQLGGAAGNVTYVVHDDPLLQVGSKQLVFLREFAPAQYVIQGGPTGHLMADGDTLKALPGSAMANGFPSSSAKTVATIRTSVAAGAAKSQLVTR